MIKILKYGEIPNEEIFSRVIPQSNVEDAVAAIIADVKENGDSALYKYSKMFDGVELDALRVTEEEISRAVSVTDAEFMNVLQKAKKNIYAFHEKQKRNSFIINTEDGVVMGQKIIPVEIGRAHV